MIDHIADILFGNVQLIIALPHLRKQLAFQAGEKHPILLHGIYICCGNTAMQMGINVLQIFRRRTVDITGDIQVILVFLLDLIIGNKPGILGIVCDLLIECGDDFVDVPLTKAVLVAVLNEVMAGINHKDTLALGGISLIDDDNAGRDTGAIKQVGGQADDALDIALVNNSFADSRLRIATEQNTMGKNDRSLAGAFQRLQNME